MNGNIKAQYELEQTLDALLQDYRDLKAPVQSTLPQPPSALEALRMVNAAHPTVIYGFSPIAGSSSGGEPDWDDAETYAQLIIGGGAAAGSGTGKGEGLVTIAVTDDGFADSVRLIPSTDPARPDGIKAFVKPLEERIPIRTFLSRLRDPDVEPQVLYLQSQDGNVYRSYAREGEEELKGLREWVKRDVEWMRDATGESADAVNLWIGSERSSTSLHHDPYDNIYHVLSGTKTFTLISPIEGLWLDQRFFPSATLTRDPSSSSLRPSPDVDTNGKPAPQVPWVESTIYPKPIQPIIITLNKGETLFLPAGWWHAVDQKEGPGGVAVAINYWYTSPLHPERNALFQLAQRTARLAGREGVIPVDVDIDVDENDESPPSRVPEATDTASAARDAVKEDANDSSATSGITGKQMAEDGVPDIWGDEDEGSGEEWDPTEWRRERQAAKVEAARGVQAKRT